MIRHPVSLTILFTGFIAVAYGMGIYLFGTLLPDMRAELGLTPEITGRIAGIGQLGTITASLLIGAVWVRIGALTTLLGCQAVIAVTMVLIGLSTQPWQLMVLMAVLGACAASSWIALVPVVQLVIAENRRGIALGLMSSGLAYGVFLIGIAGPYIISHFGWRACWFAAGGLAAFFFIIGSAVLYGLPPVRPGAGAVAAPAEGKSGGALSAPGMVLIAINLLAGLSFHPFQTYLTLLFRDYHHWSMPAATALWSAMGIGGMVGGLAFGVLADKVGVKRALVLANVILLAACLTVWLFAFSLPVYAALVGFGIAYNAIWGLYAAWMSRRLASAEAARLMGLTLVSSGLGSTSGNYLGGIITGLPGGYMLLYGGIVGLVALMTALSVVLPADKPDGHARLDPHNPPA